MGGELGWKRSRWFEGRKRRGELSTFEGKFVEGERVAHVGSNREKVKSERSQETKENRQKVGSWNLFMR